MPKTKRNATNVRRRKRRLRFSRLESRYLLSGDFGDLFESEDHDDDDFDDHDFDSFDDDRFEVDDDDFVLPIRFQTSQPSFATSDASAVDSIANPTNTIETEAGDQEPIESQSLESTSEESTTLTSNEIATDVSTQLPAGPTANSESVTTSDLLSTATSNSRTTAAVGRNNYNTTRSIPNTPTQPIGGQFAADTNFEDLGAQSLFVEHQATRSESKPEFMWSPQKSLRSVSLGQRDINGGELDSLESDAVEQVVGGVFPWTESIAHELAALDQAIQELVDDAKTVALTAVSRLWQPSATQTAFLAVAGLAMAHEINRRHKRRSTETLRDGMFANNFDVRLYPEVFG